MTTKLRTLPLASVADAARCTRLERAWDSSRRVEYFKADVALRQRNEEAAKEGRPLELFWRHLYRPDQVGWWVHSRGRGGGRGGSCSSRARRRARGTLRAARWPACPLADCCPPAPAVPLQGMFCAPPAALELGARLPEGDGKPAKGVKALEGGKGFDKDGVEYQ